MTSWHASAAWSSRLIGRWWKLARHMPICLRRGTFPGPACRARILLAGVPRSGSTWISRVVAASTSVRYLHEPFNPDYYPRAQGWDIVRTEGLNDPEWHAIAESVFDGRLFTWFACLYQPPWRMWTADILLVKDVNTMFSMGALKRYHPTTHLLLRHPCAVAQSLHARHLHPPLAAIREGLRAAAGGDPVSAQWHETLASIQLEALSPWERFGIYWGTAYGYAMESLDRPPTIWRYEDFCDTPHQTFRRFFDVIGAAYTTRAAARVDQTTRSRHLSYTKRDAQITCRGWKDAMSQEAQRDTLRGVESVCPRLLSSWYASL